MAPPLAGIRVLDLTTVIAGPYCCYQLALMGAEVIKVEQPGSGDFARQLGADPALIEANMGASFLGLGAGKRSLTLNLKAERGAALFRELVTTADVLVENFRPGVMTRLGLDYEALRPLNERLIYCAISGFGQQSPLKDNPAFDQIVQGLSGAMSTTGTPESGPLRAGYPVSDTVAGLNAAFAVAAALAGRGRDGAGQFIDVSMLDSTISILGWVTSNWLIAGQAPVPMGNDNFTASPSGAFQTQDALLNVAANKPPQFEALCRTIGRPELIADPRFADRQGRLDNRDALKAEVEAALRTRPAAEWEVVLNQAGVPAARVRTLPEALGDAHTAQRGSVKRFENVRGLERPVDVFTAGWQVGEAPHPSGPPPALGQDNAAILAELGYGEAQVRQWTEEGVL